MRGSGRGRRWSCEGDAVTETCRGFLNEAAKEEVHRHESRSKMPPKTKKAIRYFCKGCSGNPFHSLVKKDVERHQIDTGHRGMGSDLVNAPK